MPSSANSFVQALKFYPASRLVQFDLPMLPRRTQRRELVLRAKADTLLAQALDPAAKERRGMFVDREDAVARPDEGLDAEFHRPAAQVVR